MIRNPARGDRVVYEGRKGVVSRTGKVMSTVRFFGRPYKLIINNTDLLEEQNE